MTIQNIANSSHSDNSLLSFQTGSNNVESIPDAGMFDLARIESPASGWPMAIFPAIVAWLGSVSFIGLYRVNDVTASLDRIFSLREIFLGTIVLGLASIAISVKKGNFGYCVLWSTIVGYLAGHELFARLPVHDANSWKFPFEELSHGIGFAWHRLT